MWQFNENLIVGGDVINLVFVARQSNPELEWPRFQPGPLNASTGFREISTTIEFDAPAASINGWHRLRLCARACNGPCPQLALDLNGRRALVFPRPSRIDRRHAPVPPSPISGIIDRQITIPPDLLKVGANRLTITTVCVDDVGPDELSRAMRPDLDLWFGSALQWTGLTLLPIPPPKSDTEVVLDALPLYVRGFSGQLEQLFDLLVLDANPFETAHAILETARGPISLRLDADGCAFGDLRLRFGIPEITEREPAELRITLAGSVLRRSVTLRPARKWTVHVLPHAHLDIGFTDRQAKALEVHNRNLLTATALLADHDSYAFSVDGSLVVEGFLHARSGRAIAATLKAMREGRIGVNAFWAHLLSGTASLEELYRSLYTAAALERQHGVPMSYAHLTDIPSYSWAIPSVLAHAGIGRFMGVANHVRGGNADSDTLHLLSPVRWVGPDGASVVAFFADSYSQLRFMCGDPFTVAGCADALTRYLARYDRDDYLPLDLPIVGTHADNEDLAHGYADVVDRWNARYEWPRLRFSTIGEYLATVSVLADELPVLRGDGGSFWEDMVGAAARATAVQRENQMLLPAAEALAALTAAIDPTLRPDIEAFDRAWECQLIGAEHTWTSSRATQTPFARQSVEQLDWTIARIEEGARIARDQADRAMSQLGAMIPAPEIPSVLVFNPLSWSRDVLVEVELPAGHGLFGENGPLPAEPIGEERDGLQNQRVHVAALPALGYRVLSIRPAEQTPALPDETAVLGTQRLGEERNGSWIKRIRVDPLHTLGDRLSPIRPEMRTSGPLIASGSARDLFDTPRYTLRVDQATGRIVSLVHKRLDRELLDTESRWRLGDVLRVTGGGSRTVRGLGDERTTLFDCDPDLPAPSLAIAAAETQSCALRRTPWGLTITTSGVTNDLSATKTELCLHNDSDRIDLRVTIDKESELAKESLYVAFPFSRARSILYDRQQGWVDPTADHYAGAGNEWLSAQHAVVLRADTHSITWTPRDAPLFTFDDVVRGRWPTSFEQTSGLILSWVTNNYWFTNSPAAQAGHLTLRYAFVPSAEADLAAAARFGRDVRSPAIVGGITYTDRCDDEARPLRGSGTLCPVDLPANVVASFYAGRNGGKVVARLHETAGEPAHCALTHPRPGPGNWAQLCTATEAMAEVLEVGDRGVVELALGPHEVKTIAFGW